MKGGGGINRPTPRFAPMMAVNRAATIANNRHMREGHTRNQRNQRYQPRPDELQWHTFINGLATSPIATMLAVALVSFAPA
jgi:hypothetical protein